MDDLFKKIFFTVISAALILVVLMTTVPIIMHRDVYINGKWSRSDISELELQHCTDKSIKNLKYFTSLEKLTIYGNEPIKNIDFLSEMNELTYLEMGNFNVDDWSKLQNCKKLKTLYIFDANIYDFNALSDLQKLEDLIISIMHRDSKEITDFSGIENLKALRSLSVCCNSSDISPIGKCSKLTNLVIHTDSPINLTQIKQLNALEKLEIWKLRNSPENITLTGLSDLNNLSEITLSDVSSNDFNGLLNMDNLRHLRLFDCTISDEVIQVLREKKVSVKVS